MSVIIGEEVAQYNGAYKVTEGLWKKFGDKRLVDAPISEAGFIGLAVGASMLGCGRSWSSCSGASPTSPSIRSSTTPAGPLHERRPHPLPDRHPRSRQWRHQCRRHSFPHPGKSSRQRPGLKVVCPATAYDAKGLMKTAIRDNDPVMFMENTLLYGEQVGSAGRGIS